jgi:excisionase family DNA binding protein
MTMTVRDVARRLGVHPETVRRWIRDGKLEAIQLPSGRWGVAEYRITEEALTKFLSGDQNKTPGS